MVRLVSYAPLWKTMEEKDITTYALIEKHKVQSKTVCNLKHNKNITTATPETLCGIPGCTPNDILTFIKQPPFILLKMSWEYLLPILLSA